jgi:hypothetical protein
MDDGCFLATRSSLARAHVFFYSTDIIQQVSTLIALKMDIQCRVIDDVNC